VNEAVGPFRAAAAQAEVLLTSAHKVPLRMRRESMKSMFGELLTMSTLQELRQWWNAEAQEASKDILMKMHEQIAASFQGHDKSRFLEIVRSL
jgi:hypothetical protein